MNDPDASFFEDDFTMLYTQDSDLVGYCGVRIATFRESTTHQRVADFVKVFEVTDEQKEQARKKLITLPEHVLDVMPQPDLYLIWSSS